MGFNFNTFHSDSWDVSFSNLPSVEDNRELSMFDRFVKSVVIPDYNIDEIMSHGPNGFMVRHPVGRKVNYNLSQVQIEFKLTEDARNYLYLFEWMQSIKYATSVPDDNDFRKYTIKGISINIKDNQLRNIATLTFTQCFLLTLSSLGLEQGSSDEVSFTCNFSYEELRYNQKGVLNC